MQNVILARRWTFAAIALAVASLHSPVVIAQTQQDVARRAWENREMLKAKRRFDVLQSTHPMTDAQAATLANRDFNAMLAKEQIALIKRADKTNEAYGKALLGSPQAPIEQLKGLEEKARIADKAAQDGWERIKKIRASQAVETKRQKLLNEMSRYASSIASWDAIQGHRPRNAAEGYGEVNIKTQAAAIAKLPRYRVAV